MELFQETEVPEMLGSLHEGVGGQSVRPGASVYMDVTWLAGLLTLVSSTTVNPLKSVLQIK